MSDSESFSESTPPIIPLASLREDVCGDFVREVRRWAQVQGKEGDDRWIATVAARFMQGDALHWLLGLDPSVRERWPSLESALLQEPHDVPTSLVDEKSGLGRLPLDRLDQKMLAPPFLKLKESEWLKLAKARREKFENEGNALAPGLVQWLLMRNGEELPGCAIQTGSEPWGQPLYTARAWINGTLRPGKCARHLYGKYPCAYIARDAMNSHLA